MVQNQKRELGSLLNRYKWLMLAFDLIFSAVFALGRRIIFLRSCGIKPEGDYFRPVDGGFFADFFVCFLVFGLLLAGGLCLNRLVIRRSYAPALAEGQKSRTGRRALKLFFIALGVMLICWLPYLLSCLPGGIYSDTFTALNMAYYMDDVGIHALNNHHPILYTLALRLAIVVGRWLGHGLVFSMGLFTLCQYISMAAILSYLLVWMYRRMIPMWIILMLLAVTALFPLFPLYAVSVWKDTSFSLALLLFVLCLGELAYDQGLKRLKRPGYLLRLGLLAVLVAFTRNNGKYIVVFAFLILVLIKVRHLWANRRMLVMFLATLAVIQVIQGPVYDRLGFNTDTATESLAIPMQQICYVVSEGYDLTEEEAEYIGSIAPLEEIQAQYNPYLFDTIKFYIPEFDISVVENDYATFFKVYLGLLARYPMAFVRAYLLETAGFWAIGVAGEDAYVQNYMHSWNNVYNLERWDLLQELTGIDFQGFVNRMPLISSAAFFWLMVYAAFILLINRDWRKFLLLVAPFVNWLSIMVATPVACSLRYVYILVLMVPLDLMLILTSGGDRVSAGEAGTDPVPLPQGEEEL